MIKSPMHPDIHCYEIKIRDFCLIYSDFDVANFFTSPFFLVIGLLVMAILAGLCGAWGYTIFNKENKDV